MKAAAAALLLVACAHGPRTLARGALAYDVAVSGTLVATIELQVDFALVLRDGAKLTQTRLGPHDRDFVHLAVAGDLIAVAGLDGTVRTFDRSGAEKDRYRLDAAATAVALSPDGTYLLSGSASGALCLRRTADGALLQCVDAHDGPIVALAADAHTVVSAGADQVVAWSLPALQTLSGQAVPHVAAVAIHDGHVAFGDGPIAVLPDGTLARIEKDRVTAHGRTLLTAPNLRALASDGKTLYVAGFTSGDLSAASLRAIDLP